MAWTTTAISATSLTWASRSNPPSFPQGYAHGRPAPPGLCCRGAAPDPARGAAPGPRWGLRPQTSGPLLKKAGENLLENFSGFPAEHAGGPLMGSGPLAWHGKTPAEGGRRLGAARPERAAPGPLSPGPLFCLAAEGRPAGPPLGLPNAAAPPRNPTFLVSPGPARLRRHYGGCSWEAGMSGRTRRGRSRAPPVAEKARRKPSEQGS